MPRRYDKQKRDFDIKLNAIFFKVLTENEYVDVDMICQQARKDLVPPKEVSSRLPAYIKRHRSLGYLKSTKTIKISERNDSSKILIYKSTIWKGAKV